MNIVFKILLAIVAFIAINQFVAPLLMGVTFGIVILIILYVVVIAWLLGKI